MKKLFLFPIIIFLVLFSCKKGTDGTSSTLMLGEVYRNGLLDIEYIYSTDKRPIRINNYAISGNQSKLSNYILYEYGPDDLIQKRKILTIQDTLNNYYVHTYNNAGQISRMDWYLYDDLLLDYRLYEYDQKGRLLKYTSKQGSNNTPKNYVEHTYDDQDRLIAQSFYSWQSNAWVKTTEVAYTPTGKNVYAHWRKYMTYAGDFYLYELGPETRHLMTFDAGGNVLSDYTETATNRQYNGSGYVVKQTLTVHYVKPVKADEVRQMEYTYVQ